MFTTITELFKIPTNGFRFLHILINTYCSFCFVFLIVILVGEKWHLIVILICTFLMTKDAEHHFVFFLATCISSLDKYLFMSIVYF